MGLIDKSTVPWSHRFEATRDELKQEIRENKTLVSCHRCRNVKNTEIECPKDGKHWHCISCVQSFHLDFDQLEADREKYWKNGCPVCEDECPCINCRKKRERGGKPEPNKYKIKVVNRRASTGAVEKKSDGKGQKQRRKSDGGALPQKRKATDQKKPKLAKRAKKAQLKVKEEDMSELSGSESEGSQRSEGGSKSDDERSVEDEQSEAIEQGAPLNQTLNTDPEVAKKFENCLQVLRIPCSKFTPEHFERAVIRQRVPVVLTGAMEAWDSEKWTLEYLAKHYPQLDMPLRYMLVREDNAQSFRVLKDSLKTATWVHEAFTNGHDPASDPDVSKVAVRPGESIAIYSKDFCFAECVPEWKEDILHDQTTPVPTKLPPYLTMNGPHDMFSYLPPVLRPVVLMGYIGGTASRTPMHCDKMGAVAFNVVVDGDGEKRWWFVHADDRQKLEEFLRVRRTKELFEDAAWIDPCAMKAHGLRMWETVQKKGDMVLVPSGMPHTVMNLGAGYTFAVAANVVRADWADVCWHMHESYRKDKVKPIYRFKTAAYFGVKTELERLKVAWDRHLQEGRPAESFTGLDTERDNVHIPQRLGFLMPIFERIVVEEDIRPFSIKGDGHCELELWEMNADWAKRPDAAAERHPVNVAAFEDSSALKAVESSQPQESELTKTPRHCWPHGPNFTPAKWERDNEGECLELELAKDEDEVPHQRTCDRCGTDIFNRRIICLTCRSKGSDGTWEDVDLCVQCLIDQGRCLHGTGHELKLIETVPLRELLGLRAKARQALQFFRTTYPNQLKSPV